MADEPYQMDENCFTFSRGAWIPNTPEAVANIVTAAVFQFRFFFSVDNLCQDLFTRSHMDSEGYIPIAFVANYPTVLQVSFPSAVAMPPAGVAAGQGRKTPFSAGAIARRILSSHQPPTPALRALSGEIANPLCYVQLTNHHLSRQHATELSPEKPCGR